MHFANILTVYHADAVATGTCKNILTQNNATFELLENTFFIQTQTKAQTSNIITALKHTGLTYTFLFIFNTDGSALRTNGVPQSEVDKVAGILNLLT